MWRGPEPPVAARLAPARAARHPVPHRWFGAGGRSTGDRHGPRRRSRGPEDGSSWPWWRRSIGGAAGAGIAEAVGTGNSGELGPRRQGRSGDARARRWPAGAQIPTIVKSVLPEVVSIDAKGPGSAQRRGSSGGPSEDQGTGMIISSTGEVITNNHVISGATTITVTLYGQTTALPATLVGADPSSDAALLKINSPPANLQAVTFGDSTKLQVGDAVIAIGNALGLSAGTPTVTSGIVSATGRTVQAGDAGGGAGETLQNMIQTDAAINSGNSGGPLVDSAGQVVGMNTAVASSSTGNAPAQNIGFAIPSSTIQGLVATLARRAGRRARPRPISGSRSPTRRRSSSRPTVSCPPSGALVVSVVTRVAGRHAPASAPVTSS